MKTDPIFWIASMTNLITSVAAMILVDDGKLELDAPVSRNLPELKDMQVAREATDATTAEGGYALEPQKRAMTLRDLLRHTAGFIYPEMDYVRAEPRIKAIHTLYGMKAAFGADDTLADFVASLAALPLAHQPGEVWEYSWGIDVLARVVEVASGEPFGQFLQSRVFGPLHMVDTGFYVPEVKLFRLAAHRGTLSSIRHRATARTALGRRRPRVHRARLSGRSGFVVMKKPPIGGGAAIGRGHDGR